MAKKDRAKMASQIRARLVSKLRGRTAEAFKEADRNWRGVRHILGWVEKDMEAFAAQCELTSQILKRDELKELGQIDEQLRTLHYRITSALCLGSDPAAGLKKPQTCLPQPDDIIAGNLADAFGNGLQHMEPDYAADYEGHEQEYEKRFKLAGKILKSTAASISDAEGS